jgi:hypothetical protein
MLQNVLCSCPQNPNTGLLGSYSASVQLDKFWKKDKLVLNVGFMSDYPDFFKQRIINTLTGPSGWQTKVGPQTLSFNFSGTGNYDILVTQFDPQTGQLGLFNSFVGTDSVNFAATGKPSMCLGFHQSAGYPDREIDRLILHEFGHALGLIHEQSHPERAFRLKPAPDVYKFFRDKYGFDSSWVDFNVLKQFSKQQTTLFKPFDTESIMMYELPPDVAEPPMHQNYALSSVDIETIKELYGKKKTPKGVTLQVAKVREDDTGSGDFAIRDGYEVMFNFHAKPGKYVAFNLFAQEYLDITQDRVPSNFAGYWKNVNPFGSLVFQRIIESQGSLKYDTSETGTSQAGIAGEVRLGLRKEPADVKKTLIAMRASGGGTYMVWDVNEEQDVYLIAKTMSPDSWAWFQVKVAQVS